MEDLPARLQGLAFPDALDPHHRAVPRGALPGGNDADYASVSLVLVWALVPLALGLVFLQRHRHEILQAP